MSIKLMGRIFELHMDIPAEEKFLLIAMADYARDDGTGCHPSMGTLAKKTSLTVDAVRAGLRSLETAHFIERVGTSKQLEYKIDISLIPGDENPS